MKKNGWLMAWLLFAPALMAQSAANVVKVTVDGLAYMGDTDTMQSAKERAMKDAERKAIEQGTGLYIESYSKVHNYMTVEDDIKSLASGYITSKKVLLDAMEAEPPRYHVQIEAEVKCGDLAQLTADRAEEAVPPTISTKYDYHLSFEAKTVQGSWQPQELKEGDVVHVGDRLRLEMTPANSCHLLAVCENGKGELKRLFPGVGQEALQVPAGKTVQAPADGSWLVFNSSDVGSVTIFQFAAQKKMVQLNWLLEKAEHTGGQGMAQEFKKMVQGVQKKQQAIRRAPLVKRAGRRGLRSGETMAGKGVLTKSLHLQVEP